MQTLFTTAHLAVNPSSVSSRRLTCSRSCTSIDLTNNRTWLVSSKVLSNAERWEKPFLELLEERQRVPPFPGGLDPVHEVPLRWPKRVIKPILLKEPPFELLPALAVSLHFEHLCVDAWCHHSRESDKLPILWDVPHYHLGLIGLQITCSILSPKPTDHADRLMALSRVPLPSRVPTSQSTATAMALASLDPLIFKLLCRLVSRQVHQVCVVLSRMHVGNLRQDRRGPEPGSVQRWRKEREEE